LSGSALARLTTASGGLPFAASDTTVSLFADFYYEFDSNDRVSLERIYSGSKTITFSYSGNPRYAGGGASSSSASTTPGTNVWIYKTIETRPDDSQTITYADYAGQTMLSVLKASATSADQWCTFFLYDDAARQIWMAQPSAVTGYDDAFDDLLHYSAATGKYQYLRDNVGLIQVTEYYTNLGSSSSASGSALADGYVKAQKIRKGQVGTLITVRSFEYTSQTVDATTVYPVSKDTAYPDAANPLLKIETTFAYTFHSGTTQIAQKTTTLPIVPVAQNGSGVATTRKDYFDVIGHQTWSMNERGFISQFVYDALTGALMQRIDDVDTSIVSGAPVGWTTPSGGGLNLVTDLTPDSLGRNTQQLGPSHVIDINGVATTIRSAVWTVYDDAVHTVRSATGYATGTAPSYVFTLINPVQIREFDKSGKPIAVIRAVLASTSGKLLPTDSFPQSTFRKWTTFQYTDCCLLASQRVYHLIPASGIGVSGTNYNETSFGYDVMKRRNRTASPGGTIGFAVLDVRNLQAKMFVGTNDTGAIWTDPTGGGAAGNNMVQVSGNQYDNGNAGGDGNLTQMTACSESTYADAGTVTNDVIMEQSSLIYDAAGTVMQTSAKQRYHNAPDTQKGALGSPSLTPNARVTWQAAWTDGAGRQIAFANYGTNGGATFTRPATVPTRSNSVLVTTTQYNDAGDRTSVFDPNNQETRFDFDAAGRAVKLIENYQASGPVQPDVNRTTQTSYNADGNVATLTAWNSQTGNQTTNYTYGTTLTDSDLATSTLLQQVAYPDSVGGSDVVLLSYNRLGQRKRFTDQRGCAHSYVFDGLGRQIHDCVTTPGAGVDSAVRRLSTQYDVRGLVTTMSSWDNATIGSGSVVNQVQNAYNDFAQITQSWQAHAVTVNTGTTPQVQYSYASGSANTIRSTGMTYPNGRNVVDDYGTTGSIDDACSRVRGMKDFGATANLVDYSYLGLSGFVKTVYPESSIQYTLIGTAGGNNPDSGDIYLGFDRFGRVTDSHWANSAGSTTLGRVKYGYDRVSNRTWRDNLSPGMTVGSDELYSYDQLQRLQNLNRGTLNTGGTAITSPTFGQNWTLDETGNWSGFKQDNDGNGTWELNQSRTTNTVNEIKTITNATSSAWTTPAYDAAGNMTRIPVPGTLPDGVAWNSMSLSEWDNLKLADWEEMTLDNVEGVYDAWNRLVRLHVGDTTLAVYAYDARGYRIRKDSYTSGTLSEARHYYYTPGWQVIEERVASSTTANRQFVWGLRYIDDLVLRDRDTDGNGTLDERRYCLQDGNWNTIAIANTTGTVTERFSYDAYGVPTFLNSGGTVQASSPTGWETLYAGYRWDGEPSRMYYVRNRFLLPYLGTWNRRDPLGYPDGTSLFALYHSLNSVDPFGLGFWSVVGSFAAGAVVGVVVGFAIGATVAVLSPVAGAIVVGAVVVSTVVQVGALGVRAYHGDVSAEEVAFTAGAFATGGRGFRSGRGFGKVISEPILPDTAFELPGFGSSPSGTTPFGGKGTGGSGGGQTSAPRCRHHGAPKSLKDIESAMEIVQSRPNDVYVETPPFGATTGRAGPKQTLNAAGEGAFVEFNLPQGAYPDIGLPPRRGMAIPLHGRKSLPLENLNPEFHKVPLWERCVNSFKKRR